MGLLDIGDDPLMGLATGLLSASGPSRTPVSFGQALSAGVQGMNETRQNAMRNKLTQFQMDEMKRKVEQQQAMQEALKSAPPEIQRAVSMGVPMDKIWERMNPEAKWVDGLDDQGRPVKGWATANGFKQVGGAQAKPLEWKDTGAGLTGIDPYTGLPTGQAMPKSVSPDTVYSGGITMRGQNMTDSRAREQISQPVLENGQWVYKPTQANPQGAAVPIPGVAKKLPEGANKQLAGAANVKSAADDYIAELGKWSKAKMLSPDGRAAMGTKYNNLMLQAKEAYNLGVLNGPDLEILTSIVADPNSPSSVFISTSALAKQATELKRIMDKIAEGVNGQYGGAGQGNSDPLGLRGK